MKKDEQHIVGTNVNHNLDSEVVTSDFSAMLLADRWHSGQWSGLYALSSTGAIVWGVLKEVQQNIDQVRREERGVLKLMELYKLKKYIEYRAEQCDLGPQSHWDFLHRWQTLLERNDNEQEL